MVVMRGEHEFLYSDGSKGSRPGYRALADMGYSEEQEFGDDEKLWARYTELSHHYEQLVSMTLPDAYRVARERGYANRVAVVGETVTVLARKSAETDMVGVVTDSGVNTWDRGEYVTVRLNDSGKELTYPLHRIRFHGE